MAKLISVDDCPCDGCKAKPCGHPARCVKFTLWLNKTVDAVEVVRCEKCLYRSQYPDESGHYKCGGLLTEDEEPLLMVKPDFFCAYGKRRVDNAAD